MSINREMGNFYTYTIEFYSAMTCAGKCIEPEIITLNKISQTHKYCSFFIFFIENLYTDVCACDYGLCVVCVCLYVMKLERGS